MNSTSGPKKYDLFPIKSNISQHWKKTFSSSAGRSKFKVKVTTARAKITFGMSFISLQPLIRWVTPLSCNWSALKRWFVFFPQLCQWKERHCKFPLACILRQSWQDEVITEWLTHQHGKDLSPPGREIAKSQFTHIELPVRPWSHSCKLEKPHTDSLTLTDPCVRTCSKAPLRCRPPTTTCVFLLFIPHMCVLASVSPHA